MNELKYEPGAITRILQREYAGRHVVDVTFGYRGRDLMEPPGLREHLRRRLAARLLELSPEHATPAAWQGQLSTGILGALVPSCPDGVGVLSFGVDAAMRKHRLAGCPIARLRRQYRPQIRRSPYRHALPSTTSEYWLITDENTAKSVSPEQ